MNLDSGTVFFCEFKILILNLLALLAEGTLRYVAINAVIALKRFGEKEKTNKQMFPVFLEASTCAPHG